MLTPEALATLTVIAAVGIGSALGWDRRGCRRSLIGWGVWTLGPEARNVGRDLHQFVTIATHAQNDKDIDRAADHFAHAIAVIGVDGLATIILHKAFKAVRKFVGGGDSQPARATSRAWKDSPVLGDVVCSDAGSAGDPAHFDRIYKSGALESRAKFEREGKGMSPRGSNVQEFRGEINAFFFVEQRFPGYKQILSLAKSTRQGFDGVWEDDKGHILIVESKGGDSPLKEFPDVGKQMGYDWVLDRAKVLKEARSSTLEERAVGDKILKALAKPDTRVQGVVVRTPRESGAAALIETRAKEMTGIEDIDSQTGIIDYSATYKRRNP